MALGNMARAAQAGQAPNNATFFDLVTIVGEASYLAGGSTGIQAKIRALAGGAGRTVFGVIPQVSHGYQLNYDVATDKLSVWYVNADAADGALIEVPDATVLSGLTFKVLVVSQ